MMVAGVGCRESCVAADIVAVVEAALAAHALDRQALSAIAVPVGRAAMPSVEKAAEILGLPLLVPDRNALEKAGLGGLTHSHHSMRVTRLGSASEAAALAAIGDGARLLGPRIVKGPATCAIAIGEAR